MSTGLGFRVEKIWVYLHVADDGDEAVPSFRRGGQWYPLVAADEKRLKDYRPIAEIMAKESGKSIKLVCFERRVEIETIKP